MINKIIDNLDVMIEQHNKRKVKRTFVATKDGISKEYDSADEFIKETGIKKHEIAAYFRQSDIYLQGYEIDYKFTFNEKQIGRNYVRVQNR